MKKCTNEETQQLIDEIEDILNPFYCPKCGACGHEGCCSPDRCEELPCLYGEGYLKTYKELEEENTELRNKLEMYEKQN